MNPQSIPTLCCVLSVLGTLLIGPSQAAPLAVPKKADAVKPPAAKPPAAPTSAPKASEPLILEDKPELFAPQQKPSEQDRDRLEALSLFSTARILEQRQQYADALKFYQRALRCDPQGAGIARAIVPLAVRLGRHAEAVRYALKLVELEPPESLLLQRLGVYLTETGDYARAVLFYERATAAKKDAKPTAADILLRMEMARLYCLLENYPKAADNFTIVLDALDHPEKIPLDKAAKKALLGEPAATYSLIGEAFFMAGRLDQAVAAFQNADRLNPNKGVLAYHLAGVELRKKNPQKALEGLQVYLDQRLTTEGMAPYRLLAAILKELHKENELVERLEKLHAADPQNAPLGYFLAEQYRQAKQFDKAAPLYRSLNEKSPTLTGFRSLVEIYRRTNRPAELLAVLAQVVAKTNSLEPLEAETKAVFEDAALVKALIEAGRKQYQADPARFDFNVRLAAALVAANAKQFDAAGEFFNLALQAKPERSAETLLTWGLALLMAEKSAQAAEVFQRGLEQKLKPAERPVFYYYLAGALEWAGKTDQALAAARKAAELKSGDPRFLGRAAWILYHAKRYPEASKAYAEVIEKFGPNQESTDARQAVREARLVMSNLCVLQNQLPQAEEFLEQVLDEFPDDVSALNDLGYLWADANKKLARAERMIRKAVEAEPMNAAYRDSLGWVFYRQGQLTQAVAELEKAVALDPDPTVLDHLGDAYRALKQLDKARGAWNRAAEAFKKQGKPDKAQEALNKAKP